MKEKETHVRFPQDFSEDGHLSGFIYFELGLKQINDQLEMLDAKSYYEKAV